MSTDSKILVIGLDGATFSALQPMVEAGQLPSLGKLMGRGCWGTLESIVPRITPPAFWTSFFTGKNPGKHGIYNFTMSRPGQYENLHLVNTRDIRCETLWDILSAAGKRVGVMNVPMSYPVWPVNGFMISCTYTPPSVGVATHPPELAAELGAYQTSEQLRIKVPPDHPAYKSQALAYLDEIERVTELHGRTALRLMQSKPWDLFAVVFMTTDRIQHFFWRYLVPPQPQTGQDRAPWFDPGIAARLQSILRKLDDAIGTLIEQAGPEANTFVVSDHGFGPEPARTVNLHRFFRTQRWSARDRFWFLKRFYKKTMSKLSGTERRYSFDKKVGVILWPKTKAWLEMLGADCVGVRINRLGVYPQGIVSDAEYPVLRAEIQKVLGSIRDPDGSPVISKVQTREEIFSGAQTPLAPDLIVFLQPGYTLTMSVAKDFSARSLVSQVGHPVRDGSHEPEGIYIAVGPAIRGAGKSRPCSIVSVAPTILALFGLPVPSDMDGEIMSEWFAPGFVESRSLPRGDATATAAAGPSQDGSPYSAKDEAEIRARLENLGYLE